MCVDAWSGVILCRDFWATLYQSLSVALLAQTPHSLPLSLCLSLRLTTCFVVSDWLVASVMFVCVEVVIVLLTE